MIGLEPTFDEHLSRLVAVFREVRRVLRDDGICWLNYGDAYVSAQGGRQSAAGEMPKRPIVKTAVPRAREDVDTGSWADRDATSKLIPTKGKPKDLMMMPARVALALQQPHLRCRGCEHVAHALKWGMWPNGRRICPGCEKSKGADVETPGWWVRSEIVWHKPNPMPESCTDRPTSAHEKLFLLTKSARYFYDAEAVRSDGYANRGGVAYAEGKDVGESLAQSPRETTARIAESMKKHTGANLRNVWTIPTHSFPDAHFATFPPDLVERPIKAGTSERGVCAKCGAPWVRETKRIDTGWDGSKYGERVVSASTSSGGTSRSTLGSANGKQTGKSETTGWSSSCCDCHVIIVTPQPDGVNRPDPTMDTGRKGMNRERNQNPTRAITRGEQRDYARQIQASPHRDDIRCLAGEAFAHYERTDRSGARPLPPDILAQCLDRGWLVQAATDCDCACKGADTVPATVLDPFGGSGTVGLVAERLQRDAILIEISATYAQMAEKRIRDDAPLLTDVTTEVE